MNDHDHDDTDAQFHGTEQWWLASLARNLFWSRLRVRESGIAEVLDFDGRVNVYESEDIARAALMEAEYRAFDGMDADDAEDWGIDLEELEPPRGDDEETLREQMMQPVKRPLTGEDR